MDKVNILGVMVDSVTMASARERIKAFLSDDATGHVIYTPNSEIIMAAKENPEFKALLNTADLIIPDGIGVVKAAKILGHPIPERVGGFDLTSSIIPYLAEQGMSVFIFGGKDGVASLAAEKLASAYPGLKIAGTESGYFTDDKPIVEKIAAAKPDFLMVCLGAPKQEEWIFAHKNELNAKVIIGAGGSADVFAGTVNRAPDFFIRHNLEWLYRIVKGKRFKRSLKLFSFAFTVYASKFKKTEEGK